MARTIVITSRHELGIEGVKSTISDRFLGLKQTYVDRIGSAELTWEGETGHGRVTAFGQTGTARLDVEANHLRIEIELPRLLAGMAGLVEAIIRGNADALRPATATPPALTA